MAYDPTADEMREYLSTLTFAEEFSEFDREEAIYWFANDYYGGQASNLYSALSMSQFHPGPLARGPEEWGGMLYDELVFEFA